MCVGMSVCARAWVRVCVYVRVLASGSLCVCVIAFIYMYI